jgi:hypothetical protein
VNAFLRSVSAGQLSSVICDLEREIASLEVEERRYSESQNVEDMLAEAARMPELKMQEAELNFQLAAQRLRNESLMRRIDASAREINYLANHAASPGAPAFCLSPLFDAVHVEHESYGVINNHRLSFGPISHYHLNWGEINYSWANLVKLLRCARCKHGLPQAVDFSVLGGPAAQGRYLGAAAGNTRAAVVVTGNAVKYALRLQPLKDRAVLLLEREATGPGGASQQTMNSALAGPQSPAARSPAKSVRINAEPTAASCAEDITLHLEGGVQTQAGAGVSVHSPAAASPSPRPHSSTGLSGAGTGAMAAAGTVDAHVEYRDAVLVVCAAVLVTLLEVHSLDAATKPDPRERTAVPAPSTPTGKRGSEAAVGAAKASQDWWEALESLLVGSAQDLALILLIFSDCLELRTCGSVAPASPRLQVPHSPLLRSSVSVRSPREKVDSAAERWAQRLRDVMAQKGQCRSDGNCASAISLLMTITGNSSEGVDGVVSRLVVDVLRTLARNS